VRANPASSILNPACMKNTRKAAINTHAVLTPLMAPVTWVWTSSACGRLAAWATLPAIHGPSETMA
jgi:hypothetical protein